jgi:hypothetical protein
VEHVVNARVIGDAEIGDRQWHDDGEDNVTHCM